MLDDDLMGESGSLDNRLYFVEVGRRKASEMPPPPPPFILLDDKLILLDGLTTEEVETLKYYFILI